MNKFKLLFLTSCETIKGIINNTKIDANNNITPNNLLGTERNIA